MCDICDRPDPTEMFHGFSLHEKCAPGYWLKNQREHSEFLAKVRVLARTRGERWARWKP